MFYFENFSAFQVKNMKDNKRNHSVQIVEQRIMGIDLQLSFADIVRLDCYLSIKYKKLYIFSLLGNKRPKSLKI